MKSRWRGMCEWCCNDEPRPEVQLRDCDVKERLKLVEHNLMEEGMPHGQSAKVEEAVVSAWKC